MEPQTDLDYNTGNDSSVLDDDTTKDVDRNNVSILVKHLKEVDKLITKHNTFDVIKVSKDMPSVDNQMIAHRLLVTYLRLFRDDLASKIKELSNAR